MGIEDYEVDPEELRKKFWGDTGDADATAKPDGADNKGWGDPDMEVLRLRRRPPPRLPIEVFGENWGPWIVDAAAAAACPPDYVAQPLLSSTSTLIGNARWPQATPGWAEPPHLWTIVVGDSGDGKSPGADCLMRDVLPEIERRMLGDFPERLREWQQASEFDKAAIKRWQEELRAAQKAEGPKKIPPMPVPTVSDIAPEKPRLRQHDVTIEQVAALLATAAPKGAVVIRDEIAGWLLGMNAYNPSGRAFWNESYGGRPFKVERRKHGTEPIDIARLVVAVYGGTQPERLAELMTGADDGLLARVQWSWPSPIPFRLGLETPRVAWAIEALDRLRELDLRPGEVPSPIFVPLTPEGRQLLEDFGRDMQTRQADAGGLIRSAYGKARGTALRLSLVLEWLWWRAKDGLAMPPTEITPTAFAAAATLVADYYMAMAERVFGDAAATDDERGAATLARWIVKDHSAEVHVRQLQRNVRLPGLRSAAQIKKAAGALVEADWLRPPMIGFAQQRKVAYVVNPRLWERRNEPLV
jgi:Protein of unknown function (DUF3987)